MTYAIILYIDLEIYARGKFTSLYEQVMVITIHFYIFLPGVVSADITEMSQIQHENDTFYSNKT